MLHQLALNRTITEALLTTIAHSTGPMALSDPHLSDHPIIAVNLAFEAKTGDPAAEIVGRNCRMLQGPDTDAETARMLRQIIAAGDGCVEWIVDHSKGGSAFCNLLFMSPERDGQGRVIHHVANQHDTARGLPGRLSKVSCGHAHMRSRRSRRSSSGWYTSSLPPPGWTGACPGAGNGHSRGAAASGGQHRFGARDGLETA